MSRLSSYLLSPFWHLSIALCLIVLASSSQSIQLSPPIQVSLRTPWQSPDLLLEIIEAVAVENSSAYFPLLHDLTVSDFLKNSLTPKQIYENAIQLVIDHGYIKSKAAITLAKFTLATHSTAPAIQAYYHYYNNTVIPEKGTAYNSACDVWADLEGVQICDILALKDAFQASSDIEKSPIHLLPFDHVLRPLHDSSNLHTIILYADILSPNFRTFHDYLLETVESNKLIYVLRYRPPERKRNDLFISGYGVELQLKNTDYLVIDDRIVDSDESSSAEDTTIGSTRAEYLQENLFEDENRMIEPLSQKDIRDLGFKVSQFIIDSADSLRSLVQLSQDFPKYQGSIAQVPVNDSVKSEIESNQMSIPVGNNLLWLNGLSVPASGINPYSFLGYLRREHGIVTILTGLGLSAKQSIDLLTHPQITQSTSDEHPSLVNTIDVRDKSENGYVVLWWNNLEKDKKYSGWSPRLFDLLRPLYPGQMRMIRKNLFNVIYVLDLSTEEGRRYLVEDAQIFIERRVPVRFGYVPLLDGPNGDATMMAKLTRHIMIVYGRKHAMTFLTEVSHAKSNGSKIGEAAERAFESIVQQQERKQESESETFMEVKSSYDDYLDDVNEFLHRVGAIGNGQANSLFIINGRVFDLDETYQRNLVMTMNEQTEYLQQKVYHREITEETDIYEYLLTLPHVYPRRNSHVFISEARPLKVIDLTQNFEEKQQIIKRIQYMRADNEGSPAILSIWVVANLNDRDGAMLSYEALKFASSFPNSRVTLLHNPSSLSHSPLHTDVQLSSVIYHAIYDNKSPSLTDLISILKIALLAEETEKHLFIDQVKAIEFGFPITEIDAAKYEHGWIKLHKEITTMGVEEQFTGVIVNGRVIGPFIALPGESLFTAEDFELLSKVELKERVAPVEAALKDITQSEHIDSSLLFTAAAALAYSTTATKDENIFSQNPNPQRTRDYQTLQGEYSRIVEGNLEDSIYQIVAVVDPLSETAQKWSGFIKTLSKMEGVYIEIYLNPSANLAELPLKRFYRYVFDEELHFDERGEISRPTAYFANIPEDPLLTLGMDVISSWLVTPKISVHDLDNIRLVTLDKKYQKNGVEALFELKNILVEGHGRDASGSPPRGLQFLLGTKSYPALVDTIVMANLGYFQLKANPGVWELSLREGRSKELYEIESVGSEGWFSRSVAEIGSAVMLTTFEGVTIFPRVRKLPGREMDELLQVDEDTEKPHEGLWDSITSSLWKSGAKEKLATDNKVQAEINIFSVASGHLYERFLSIMILTVLKHTKHTVKFWFIENFLSPSFKDFIPFMASEYNFDYELVTYKWPSWLRAQKEKQRTIWGYKILFLDVLFPLDLEKVIFVDADQIVRIDMKELVDLDLEGAPYGYTPMCDSRVEMEGFRFWKQGYWQQHLQGKPYHISALYVIDLKRFRQLAAGDRLRGQYQSLSSDPGSLANLDQDLPNNMQDQVPIFSLPQDWLWCETWCSDESLKTAKTIDLCNNPLTKEEKLVRARRQIPEWESIDLEVAEVAKKISKKKAIKDEL